MKKIIALILTLVSISICILLSGCGDDYTAQDLQDAKERYYSGQGTKQDKTMVEGFNKWKSEQ